MSELTAAALGLDDDPDVDTSPRPQDGAQPGAPDDDVRVVYLMPDGLIASGTSEEVTA